MAGPTKDLTLATRDGGNEAFIIQGKLSGSTYVDATAADVFAGTAGTAYHMGNFVSSDCSRQADGSYKLTMEIIEQDLVHLNMMELLAPVSSADNSGDELVMEDNTAKVGSKGSSFDSGKPVFFMWYFYKDLGGKKRCRHMIGQFNPDAADNGGKAKQWRTMKVTFYSIDANGSVAVTQPTDSEFTGITTPALASPYQFGKVLLQS